MRWPYRLVQAPSPVITLGGRWVRPRPLILVTVMGPSGVQAREALLDTAADDTVFSETLALQIGIDLSTAPTGAASGVASRPVPVRYADVTLRLTDGHEFREWQATVGFTSAPLKHQLLGFAGCLQFFTSTFFGHLEEVELTVNPLYPGR